MSNKVKVSKYVADRINRKKSDFIQQTFCTGGPGGQAQNKRKSGVRLVDKITGLSAESRDATGADDNKNRAFHKLVDKLIEFYKQEEFDLIVKEASPQLWVRTYKEKNDLVVDSRINGSHSYKEILNGKLDTLLEELLIAKSQIKS